MTGRRRVGSALAALCGWVLAGSQAVAAGQPEAVVDDLGLEVALAAAPQRIVSLAPSNTELLFGIGLGDRLVGVTDYCTYPPAAAAIERVADYSTLNAERVAAVRPDLVVAARGNDLEGLETLRQLGTPVFALAANSAADAVEAVRRLGRLTGQQASAESLAEGLERRLEAVAGRVAGRPRPLVLWGLAGDPIYTAGANSLIDDVIERAGGRNAGRRASGAWPQISLEIVVAWAPEVLLTSLSISGQPPRSDAEVAAQAAAALAAEVSRLRQLDGWREIPAVRQGRVVHIDADRLTRAGPRIVDAVEQLAEALHPPGASP